MINIIYEDGVEQDKLPIENLTREELLNRIVALETDAIEDEDTYTLTLEVC